MSESKTFIWTSIHLKKLKHIIPQISQKKIFHSQKANKQMFYYNILMILCICLGPISGFVSSIGAILNPDENIIFPILSTSISFVSGILIAYTKFSKFNEKYNFHQKTSIAYLKIENDLQKQLNLKNHNFKFDVYLNTIFNQYHNILNMNQEINESISYNITENNPLKIKSNLNEDTKQDTIINIKSNSKNNMFQYELNRFRQK